MVYSVENFAMDPIGLEERFPLRCDVDDLTFVRIKGIYQSFSLFWRLSRSYRSRELSGLRVMRYRRQSSAKSRAVDLTLVGRSFM
jgi:hypothetical protein